VLTLTRTDDLGNVTNAQDLLVLTAGTTDTCPDTSIKSNFNGTSIPAGRCVWFNSVMKVTNQGTGPTTIHVTNGSADSSAFHVVLPDANITFTSAVTTATTTYDAVTKTWNTSVPLGYTGNVFISGAVLDLPSGLAAD